MNNIAALIEEAERQGWRAARTKRRGHWMLYAPNGKDIITISGTPGDYRAYRNALSAMRRTGCFSN